MVNEWNKTALVTEFETMLRRRLKHGAAPVAACAGFDLDAASAYLEGALGGSHRAGYESHLAGCATCRRHLIELARLAQSVPLAEAQPVAPDRISTWWRWKEAVTGWFDISSRNFKWQLAGAAGAAFAILITALGAQSWRQTVKHSRMEMAADKVAATSQSELTGQQPGSPAPEPSSGAGGASVDTAIASQTIASNQNAGSQALAPVPHVGPQGMAPNVIVEPANGAFAVNSNLPGEAPGATNRMPSVPEGQNTATRLSALAETESLASVSRAPVNGSVLSAAPTDSKEEAARVVKDPAQVIRPSPSNGLNLFKSEPPDPVPSRWKQALVGGQQARPNSEPRASRIKEVVSQLIKRNPLKWPFSESEPKPGDNAQASADDESANILVWRFRGKVFLFVKGMWIDQDYKPEMQEWYRFSLTRDSEQYKQVLADEPQLKEFFDKGPILIVWKNQKIYKVLK